MGRSLQHECSKNAASEKWGNMEGHFPSCSCLGVLQSYVANTPRALIHMANAAARGLLYCTIPCLMNFPVPQSCSPLLMKTGMYCSDNGLLA